MKTYLSTFILSNGVEIPCTGFGSANSNKTTDEMVMVRRAIEAGYRYFDTASFYMTEDKIGQAICESGIPREEFFISSKMWLQEMGYEGTKKAFADSLERLGMDYLDSYLMHWPKPDIHCKEWKQVSIDTWRAMEELYQEGKVRSIGLSNFLPHHLDNILENCTVKPMIDQLEIHPGYCQTFAVEYAKKHGLQVQAYSPVARKALLDNFYIVELAEKYGVSPAQICLRFLTQKDIIPLPKASVIERMKENQDIFGFDMTTEEMYTLESMPPMGWGGEHPDFFVPSHKKIGEI